MQVIVEVDQLVENGQLHELDADVAGRYAIEVDDTAPLDQVAGIALDVFHDTIGIKVREDFHLFVRKGTAILHEPDDYEDYSGVHLGKFIEKVG